MNKSLTHLFAPLTVRGFTFRNRILSSPITCHALQADEFAPTEAAIRHYANKARGGAASVVVGGMNIDRLHPDDGMHCRFTPASFDSNFSMRGFVQARQEIQAHGALASLELLYPGVTPYAASPMQGRMGPLEEMPESEMLRILDCFADAAAGAKRAGFDSVFVMGVAHGMVLNTFLSPYHNRRTDQYGGSLENRARYPLMILRRVREVVGEDMLVELRVNGDDMREGGLDVYECAEFLRMLEGLVDIIHVSAGDQSKPINRVAVHPTGFVPPSANAFLAAAVKKSGVRIPIATVGNHTDPVLCDQIIADGNADFVDVARALIADPQFSDKARQGRVGDIRPCIKCFNCLDDYKTSNYYSCSVNPMIGWEHKSEALLTPAGTPRRVAVVGGGPAGMNAALTAADRGHSVTLYEAADRLGGLLNPASVPAFKYGLRDYRDWLVRQVEQHPCIEVVLNTAADRDLLESEGYETVVAALGSAARNPAIPGADSPWVMTVVEAYQKQYALGLHVLIIGGGETGCEAALHLTGMGRTVTLLEMGGKLAPECNLTNRIALMHAMEEAGRKLTSHTGLRVVAIDDRTVTAEDGAGARQTFTADTILLAAGTVARQTEAQALWSPNYQFLQAGDCVRARNVKWAIRTAHDCAQRI